MKKITKFNKDNTLQKIRAHFLDDSIEITDFEKEKLECLTFMYNLRLKYKYSKEQAMKKAQDEYKLSRATAYRYYNDMALLFGEMDKANQQIEVVFHRENYFFLYQQLLRDKEWLAAAKVYEKYVATFPEMKPEEDYLDLQTKKYVMKLDKKLEKLLVKQLSESPVIDLNKIDFQDIDFQTLDKNAEREN